MDSLRLDSSKLEEMLLQKFVMNIMRTRSRITAFVIELLLTFRIFRMVMKVSTKNPREFLLPFNSDACLRVFHADLDHLFHANLGARVTVPVSRMYTKKIAYQTIQRQ